MTIFLNNLLTMPRAALLLMGANLAAFAFVFFMQYGVGLHPCVLCVWQRIPFGVALAVSLSAWLWRPYRRQTIVLLALCTVAYLIGMGLAVFHTGVEQHLWVGTAGCSVQPLHGANPDDLRETLLHTIAPRCDEVSWTVFSLSMANLNIVASLALAVFATAAAAKAMQDV